MSILVPANHDDVSLKQVTHGVISAARAIGGDVHVLVAGMNCGTAAAQFVGMNKVLRANTPAHANGLNENVAPLVVELVRDYWHVLQSAPRMARTSCQAPCRYATCQ